MNFLKMASVGNIAKVALQGVFSTSAATYLNYKIGENGIDGVTVVRVDLTAGVIVLRLEGETRNIEIHINEIVYSRHESGLRIMDLIVSVKTEGIGTHKVWLESLFNGGVSEYIHSNDGLWIKHHTKKILAYFSAASYAREE